MADKPPPNPDPAPTPDPAEGFGLEAISEGIEEEAVRVCIRLGRRGKLRGVDGGVERWRSWMVKLRG